MLSIRVVSRLEVVPFSSLSALEQRIVATLAVVHEPVGEKALLEWLKLMPGARAKASAPEPQQLQEGLNALCSAGSVQALGSLHAPKYAVDVQQAHVALSAL